MARSISLVTRAQLYLVAREVLVASTFDEVVEIALRTLGVLIPAWRHSVGLVDVTAGTFTSYAAVGETAVFSPGKEIPLAKFGVDLSRLRAGEVDLVQDVALRPDAIGSMLRSPLRSQLIAPILDEGELVGTLNVGADVTNAFGAEDVMVMEELAELIGAALRQVRLRRDLCRAHDAALEASRAKSVFLAGMSHELRTPLNIIIGYTELLAEEDGAPVDDLSRIGDAARHLLALVSDVLDLSRIESGRLAVTTASIAPRLLADQIANGVLPLVAAKNNRWSVSVEEDLPDVLGDTVRVRQILFNLVGNAAKFTSGGTVALGVRQVGREVWFDVRDTGPGICREDFEKIFEPFTQVRNTAEEARSGAGLGLPIARRLARLMDGDLRVESEVGRGSCFTLSLPVATAR